MAKQNEFTFEIDHQNERAGWIDCTLGFGGRHYKLAASDIPSPFPHLLDFVTAIATQRLPFHFYWDEEGKGVDFDAMPLSDDDPRFHLHIQHNCHDKPWVDAVLDRSVVVDALLAELRDFSLNAGLPSRFSWHLTEADVLAVDRMLANPPSLRSDITRAERLDFSFTWNASYPVAGFWLEISVLEMSQAFLNLQDDDPFWAGWFAFLEKVLKNDLPFRMVCRDGRQIEFISELVEEGDLPESSLECEPQLIFGAEALDHVGHFRLKIFEDDCRKTNFLRVNEVLDRCQFVRGFCTIFEKMLIEIETTTPELAASAFVLRQLPLEWIRKILDETCGSA